MSAGKATILRWPRCRMGKSGVKRPARPHPGHFPAGRPASKVPPKSWSPERRSRPFPTANRRNPQTETLPAGTRPKPHPGSGKRSGNASAADCGQAREEKPASNKAILTITSAPPFAEVIVDGRFMGTTPVKDKELAPGRHKLQITHRSFPPVDTVIVLGPGEKSLRFRLFK